MKTRFFALAALLFGMAACQTDPMGGLEVDANGEAAVSVSVALPEGATRAAGSDSALGAIDTWWNETTKANYDIRFILEVYEGEELAKDRMVVCGDEDEATFNFRLVPGRDYKFVVWADFVNEGSEADLHYDTSKGLRDVEIKNAQWTVIDESRDAYTHAVAVNNYSGTSIIEPIILTRPFAKLRVVTNDIKEMKSVRPETVKVNYFSTGFYTSFDAFEQKPLDQTYTGHELVVDLTEDTYSGETPEVNGVQTLFADYFFAQEGDRVMFTMDVVFNDGKSLPQVIFNTNIPVKRNNLTTVYGPILTDANNVTVTIDPAFAGNIEVGRYDTANKTLAEVLAEASKDVEATIELANDVEWTTGAGIGSTPFMDENAKTKVLTINGNGHKLVAKGSGVGAIRMANGGKIIFNNVVVEDKSVSYAENSWEYGYLEFGADLEFNDCQFINAIQLEKANATFNRCSFNSHDDNQYGVWVCGNKAYFNECTFEGPRGLKVHEAYGSEVEEVVVDNTTFNNLTKKPGIALGTLNADTTITIKNSTFNNCQAGDQGLYIYETDTNVNSFNFTEENNFVDGVNKADDNTYKISSAEGFEYIVNMVNDGETDFNVVLNNDIDLSQYAITRSAVTSNWAPIGTSEKPFSGTFDGNGKTIKNLCIIEAEAKEGKAYIGFFGYAKDATIKNVTFENVNINIACLDIDHSQGHIGAVAGSLEGTSLIENVTVKGDIKVESTVTANGASRVAVVAGGNSYGNVTMKNVHVIANEGSYLKANNNVGALAGQLQGKSVFENCSSNIDVTGTKFFAGGIIGIAAGDQLFKNCHTTGNIAVVAGREGRANDHYRVGGIAGGWADGKTKVCTLEGCSYTGKLTGINADGSVAEVFDYMGYVGRGYTLANCAGSKVVIDGTEFVQKYDNVYGVYTINGCTPVATADELVAALEANEGVYLMNDIKIDPAAMSNAYGKTGINVKNGQTIDGNGYTLNIKGAGGTWDSGINTTGGIIRNITVTGSFRGIFINHNSDHSEKVVLENVTLTDVVYTISCDKGLYQGIEATNCTFNGWTSFAKTAGEAKFVNCYFGEGNGYKYCRPYSKTEFVGCTFCPGYTVDESQATVTFSNCTWEE